MPTALLSVYNKIGIVDFASALVELGFDLLSSGGTANTLRSAGLSVRDVADITGRPAVLGHRVVTLDAAIHGGLMADPEMREELKRLGWPWIDLVCVDLYPLEAAIAQPEATRESVIHQTDIGGPTMLRSAAKGRRIVVCDREDWARVIGWLRAGRPEEDAFVTKLCAKAESVVARYAIASARYHSGGAIDGMVGACAVDCRYGENPGLTAAFFSTESHPLSPANFTQIAGAAPSYIGMTDLSRALHTITQIAAGWQMNFGYTPCIAVAVKHGNACGVGLAQGGVLAIRKMIDSDPTSIHGGVVITNFSMSARLATTLRTYRLAEGAPQRILDGVIVPSFDEGAAEILERKRGQCRMLVNPQLSGLSAAMLPRVRYRALPGGFLRQEGEPFVFNLAHPDMVRGGEWSVSAQEDIVLAWAIGSTSMSNTITIVSDRMLIGNAVG